ncbi:Protein phosphatase 1L [Seminavis robusta]|uniref:Protein phosphatase 1L n=1 Tax=Seminavis robusta TaxID=568900 RepID=A0A9N8DIS1_9STRA|nr:Protein phosphatase 1L [Seminavis robusta]|eukprot:Sro180_g078790.1 Protein phosphatase 1L (473) ;mRNA; f:58330-59748
MLFSPLKPRQGKKLQPNKRQQRAKLSNIIFILFSVLGVIIFWVGFQVAPQRLSLALSRRVPRAKSSLPLFVKPPPHSLLSHATVPQVDAYINGTSTSNTAQSTWLGSMKYLESPSCKQYASCEIHFPFLDIEEEGADWAEERIRNHIDKRTDYAVLTRKGFKALVTNVKSNQDRAFVIAPLEAVEESALPVGPDDFLMGLFDGHGPVGHGTAHFAAMELPALILRNMQRRKKFIPARHVTEGVQSALKDSFVSLDENIPFLETSGSTGIIILRLGTHLFFASTGDSQAFLIKADTARQGPDAVTIVQSTIPHKPDQVMETARIRSAGGSVIPKTNMDTSSRVIIPVGEDGTTLALAMSRSLGDPEGKNANVIIPDPNVDFIDLAKLEQPQQQTDAPSQPRYFVVVASDGLLDKISPLKVAQRMAQSFYHETPPNPLMAANELIQSASQMWFSGGDMMRYRDDISIAVKMIDL